METREQWLNAAMDIMAPWIADHDIFVPEDTFVSVGWAQRPGKNAIGWCYPKLLDRKETHIFISPTMDDSIKVLSTLLHEMIHAADGGVSGHRGEFARVAKAVGLTGKMTATVPGDGLTSALAGVHLKLGDYPHAVLNPVAAGRVGTKKTYMLRAVCPCGYTIRLTQKWADKGLPLCPCGTEMELQ